MRGIQHVPQLVPKQFNILPIQYRLNEHLHEEVWWKKKVSFFLFCFLTKWQLCEINDFPPPPPPPPRLLWNKDVTCAYTGKSTCTRAFTEGFWYFALTIYWACAWRSEKKNEHYCGGYLISIAYYLFFFFHYVGLLFFSKSDCKVERCMALISVTFSVSERSCMHVTTQITPTNRRYKWRKLKTCLTPARFLTNRLIL